MSENSPLVSALGGIVGASAAKVFVHPIDTVKAKIQVQKSKESLVIRDVIRQTMKNEGLSGLYRGFSVSLFGSIPAAGLYFTHLIKNTHFSGLYFGSYEFFKKQTLQNQFFQSHPFLSYLAGGMFAETIACILFVPIDVIKERRQVQSSLKMYSY